jgi:hypothetical protein
VFQDAAASTAALKALASSMAIRTRNGLPVKAISANAGEGGHHSAGTELRCDVIRCTWSPKPSQRSAQERERHPDQRRRHVPPRLTSHDVVVGSSPGDNPSRQSAGRRMGSMNSGDIHGARRSCL